MAVKVLVVDDEKPIAAVCAHFVRGAGWEVLTAATGEEALAAVAGDPAIGIVFLDMRLPGRDGIEVLQELKRQHPTIEVVMITAHGSIEIAVEAMRLGASDFVPKPFTKARVLAALERARQVHDLREEVVRLRDALQERTEFEGIVGGCGEMRKLFDIAGRTAETDSTVLILGESGTGKDLVARAIHARGGRRKGPFIAVNCAALPGELIESELFGYRKGAFTGAVSDSIGLFRAAQGGTLYLDEIVEMPVGVQAKLLRALEGKRIRPVGGTDEVAVDARVIAATNQDIPAALAAGRLREDLYFRLGVISITLPPLRKRRGDIPLLVDHFLAKLRPTARRAVERVAPEALHALENYPWPGNVRELSHAIERAVAVGEGPVIRPADLPPEIRKFAARVPAGASGAPVVRLADAERDLLAQALDAAGGNRSHAAQLLGVSRKKLYHMIAKYQGAGKGVRKRK